MNGDGYVMRHALAAFCLFMLLCISLLSLPGCPPPVNITITAGASEVAVGATLQLTATSTDTEDVEFTWASNSMQRATVDENGLVTGTGLGAVVISATGAHSGRSATAQFTVVAGSDFNISLPADPETVRPVQTADNTLGAAVCTLQTPGIAAEVRNAGGALYHRLLLPGTGSTEEQGLPEIPFYTLYFAVPRDSQTGGPAAWDVSVSVVSEQVIEKIRAYPAQPPAWIESDVYDQQSKVSDAPESERPAFTIKEAFYQTAGPYPQSRTSSSEFDMGNLHLVEVRVFPALYYPQARQLRLASELKVDVEFSSPNGLIDPEVVGDISDQWEIGGEEWIPSLVVNAERVQTFTVDDLPYALAPLDRTTLQDNPLELLIVTRPALFSQAYEYGCWKQDQGIRVFLASLSEEAYPDADAIREYIREKDAGNRLPSLDVRHPYAMWALCLFGDTEIVPACTGMNYRGYANPAPGELPVSIVDTDHLYATVRSEDDLPDFAVGRISVDNETQADNVLKKIKNYEGHVDPPHHMAVYGHFVDEIWPLGIPSGTLSFTVGSTTVTGTGTHFTTQISTAAYADYLAIPDAEWNWYGWYDVATVLSDTELVLTEAFDAPADMSGRVLLGGQDGQDDWEFVKGPERVRRFMTDRGVTARFGYTREPGPTPIREFDGADLAADLLGYGWDATTANIQDNWAEGLDGIVLHCDHGERHGWQNPPFYRINLVTLSDSENGYYPIVFSINCDSGWFDNETDTRIHGDGVVRADGTTPADDESFCERAVRFANGGAVATVGACRGSEACHNDKLIDGLFAGMYEDYVTGSVLVSHHPACTRLGSAVQWAKLHQRSVVDDPIYRQYNMQIWHLFGDPALRLNLPEPDTKR